MNQKVNLAHFSKVFKQRINLRSSSSNSPEIVLLDGFKYYDIKNSGKCDYKSFCNVLKRRFEMNMFSDSDIQYIFDYYSEFLEGKKGASFNYKDFIALFLNVSNIRSQNSTVRNKSMTKQSQKSKNINPGNIETIIEFLILKGKKQKLGYFFYLYKSMYPYKKELDEQKLQQIFQKHDINFNSKEITDLVVFFDSGNQKLDFYKFWDILASNFNSSRKQQCREMFKRLDFRNSKFINFEVLQNLFLPKNYYKVQQGLISLNKIGQEFNKYISDFTYFIKNQNSDIKDFILFMKLLSIQIEREKDFQQFINNNFRYNDVKQINFQKSYQMNYSDNKSNSNSSSYLTEEELLSKLKQVLKQKGLNSYLNFYFRLKRKDHQKDGYLFYEDFYQLLVEFKCAFTEKEIKQLFSFYCGQGTKMNYNILLENLVTYFNSNKCKQIKLIFQKLNKNQGYIRFEKIQDNFNPNYHPEVISQEKSQSVVKQEFLENLQQFLVYYKGSHLQIDEDSLTRFLEFYTQDWEDQTFKNFIENSFQEQVPKNFNHHQNVVNKPPFATDDSQNNYFKKKVGNPKLYEEFNQKQKSPYKFQSPYHTDDLSQKRSNYSIRKSKRTQKLSQIDKSQRSQVSQITRQSKSIRSYLSKPSNKKIHEINLELQKHHKPSQNTQEKQEEIPEESYIQKLRQTIRNSKDFSLMLEYEYLLTNSSNLKGEISENDFIKVSKELKCIQDLNGKQLSTVFNELKEGSYLHVQTFANYIRDQMSEDEEVLTIDLFDRLCAKYHAEVLDITKFKNSFVAKNFTYSKGSISEIQEMFNFAIELFEALNVSIKNVSWLDLDDFLYLFDNFTFYFQDIKKFGEMLNRCFR